MRTDWLCSATKSSYCDEWRSKHLHRHRHRHRQYTIYHLDSWNESLYANRQKADARRHNCDVAVTATCGPCSSLIFTCYLAETEVVSSGTITAHDLPALLSSGLNCRQLLLIISAIRDCAFASSRYGILAHGRFLGIDILLAKET